MYLPEVRMGEGSAPWDRPFGARVTQGDLVSARETGVEVFILAWPQADGRLRVDAVGTGEDGRAPPM
jgi:hypothetical protein